MKKLVALLLAIALPSLFASGIRPKDEPAAPSPASDDKILIDGVTNGVRSLPANYYQAAGAPLTTSGANPMISPIASVANLRAYSVAGLATGTAVNVLGYYAAGDGGGGWFVYDGSSVANDDGGRTIAPNSGVGRWNRPECRPTNVRWYGARGDGATDDSPAIANALASMINDAKVPYVPGIGRGGELYFPAGVYKCNFTLPNDCTIRGELSGTILEPQDSTKPLIVIDGYGHVLDRTYIGGFRLLGTGTGTGIQVNGSHSVIEKCWVDGFYTGIRYDQTIGHVLRDSRVYSSGYGLLWKGSATTYSGFSLVENTRLGGNKSCIYSDNTLFPGGGDVTYRRCWFEGFPGLAYYGKMAASKCKPDIFESCWFEGMATADTVDFSDVGGPSVVVDKAPIHVDGGAISANELSASVRVYNGATVAVGNLAISDASSVPASTYYVGPLDGASEITITRICATSIFLPYSNALLMPVRQGDAVTAFSAVDTDCLDFKAANLLGDTGDCIDAASISAGSKWTSRFVDTPETLFGRALEVTFTGADSLWLGTWIGTTDKQNQYMVENKGDVLMLSYYMWSSIDAPDAGIEKINKIPTPSGPAIKANAWYHIVSIFHCGENRTQPLDFRVGTTTGGVFRLAQIQLVKFSNTSDAMHYAAGNRYAAANPDGSIRTRLIAAARHQKNGSGAPSDSATFVGQEYYDYANQKWYKARTAGAGAGDWLVLN